MPRLPQLEYNVTVQGPPNVAQAFDAVGRTLQKFQDIQNDSMMELAKEQAKAQTSTASAIVQSGLGALENRLSTTPYFKPQEIIEAYGDEPIPPHVQEAIDLAGENGSVPTMVFGASLHQAAAKQLAKEAGKEIWSKDVRSDFEQRAVAETIQRNVRLDHTLASEWAKTEAVKAEVVLDAEADAAWDLAQRDRVVAKLRADPFIDPARVEQIRGEWAKKWRTQDKGREAATLVEKTWDPTAPDRGAAELEARLVGKDPLVAEEARHKQKTRFLEEKTLREAQDSPYVANLEAAIYSRRGFSRTGGDYLNLSPEGKARVEKTAQAEYRLSKAATSEERRAQSELDSAAVTRFKSLDIADQVKINPRSDDLGVVLGTPEFSGVSGKARDAITVEWKAAQKSWKKDQGVSERAFLAEVDEKAVRLGFKNPKTGAKTAKSEAFEAYLTSAYREWQRRQPEDGPTKPSKEETDAMLRSAMDFGDKGGMHLSSNKYRFEVKPGEEFTTEGFTPEEQKGHKALEALKPAATGKVKVRRNGVVGTVTTPLPGDEVIP